MELLLFAPLTLIHEFLLFLKVKGHLVLAHVFFVCLCTLDPDRVYEFAFSSLLTSLYGRATHAYTIRQSFNELQQYMDGMFSRHCLDLDR